MEMGGSPGAPGGMGRGAAEFGVTGAEQTRVRQD